MNIAGLSPSATFRGGEGLSPYHVSCAADPMDLRPAADMILHAVEEQRAQITDRTPLVVLMGELHTMPAHRTLLPLVLSRLNEKKAQDPCLSFTVNMEIPHNMAGVLARENLKVKIPDEFYYAVGTLDPHGQLGLEMFLGYGWADIAPITLRNEIAFCRENKLSVCFNDVADDGFLLDLNDPYTAFIAGECGVKKKKVAAYEHEGVRLRNKGMVLRSLWHARERGANIIIQQAGLSHVLGNVHEEDAYEDSLCAAFKSAGARVLPVCLTARGSQFTHYVPGVNNIPEEAYGMLPQSVIVDGLSDEEVRPGSEDYEETALIHQHREASGGEIPFFEEALPPGKKQQEAACKAFENFLAAHSPAAR